MSFTEKLRQATDAIRAELQALPYAADPVASSADAEFLRKANDDVTTPATCIFSAISRMLGQRVIMWEPESVWLGLKDADVDLDEVSRNKFLAVSTLKQMPAFYWDANIFEDTCLAFCGEPVIVGVLQEATPAQLSWGVFEAMAINLADGNSYDFDHEPKAYTATSLLRDGYLLAPELLVFAQETLNRLRPSSDAPGLDGDSLFDKWIELKAKLDFDSPGLDTRLDALEFSETPLDVQLTKLLAVRLYVQQRVDQLLTQLRPYARP